jgi:cephalosporin hydroxylase
MIPFKITSDSLIRLNQIISSMDDKTFHNHYHILYDICDSIDNDITYLEIGAFAGGSASLVSSHINVTKVISVDLGQPINPSIPIRNVNKFKHENCKYDYIQGNSQDKNVIDEVFNMVDKVDILFIDGDHSKNGVIRDFENYSSLVKKGGYILFDDYMDSQFSPQVKIAVDELVKNNSFNEYEIIGSLVYPQLISTNVNLKSSNEFILKKL